MSPSGTKSLNRRESRIVSGSRSCAQDAKRTHVDHEDIMNEPNWRAFNRANWDESTRNTPVARTRLGRSSRLASNRCQHLRQVLRHSGCRILRPGTPAVADLFYLRFVKQVTYGFPAALASKSLQSCSYFLVSGCSGPKTLRASSAAC
jgi:hypothetical protein